MSNYQKFDSEIFDITKIMVGFSLSDGQKSELLKIAGEIDAAVKDGSLSKTERDQLRRTMEDCGMEFPPPPAEQAKPHRKKHRAKGQDR